MNKNKSDKYISIINSSINYRKLPINISESDLLIFDHEKVYHAPAVSVIYSSHTIINSEGIPIKYFRVIRQGVSNRFYYKINCKYIIINIIRAIPDIIKSLFVKQNTQYVLCFDQWFKGYFHWVADILPRIYVWCLMGKKAILLLPEQTPVKYLESLKPFEDYIGIKFIKTSKPKFCKNLYLVPLTASSGNYNHTIISGLRQSFYDYFYLNKNKPFRKIYVSRRQSSKRKIKNEQELIDFLKEYEYEVVCFEDFSFREQIIMASQSKVIMGLHGAGLTNMLTMHSYGSVFEIKVGKDDKNHCYFSMASALNLNYFYSFSTIVNLMKNYNNSDVEIDIGNIKKTLSVYSDYL